MTSRSQMASDVLRALKTCRHCIEVYNASKPKIWFPRWNSAWLGVSLRGLVIDEQGDDLNFIIPTSSNLSGEELREGLQESANPSNPGRVYSNSTLTPQILNPCQCIWAVARSLWNYSRVLQIRLSLSRVVKGVQGSSHLKHAFKNAAGIALLGLPAYMPSSSFGVLILWHY
jgi:hypothetical protein